VAEVLHDPEFCLHNSGIITVVDGTLRCDLCQTEMVFVAVDQLRALQRTPSEVEADLRRQNQRLRGVLDAIQHSIAVIARSPVP
jgi:hypothetical protein